MRTSIMAGAVASLIVIAASGCGAASTTVTGTATFDRQSGTSPSARHYGPPVRDGGMQFDVVDVAQMKLVGDPKNPALSVTARGVFVVVTLSLRNVGNTPLTFLDWVQTLVDSTGRRFSTDMAADIYGNRSIRLTSMDPGAELVVHIAFDVPDGTKPSNLILRQSDSSAGATVAIS